MQRIVADSFSFTCTQNVLLYFEVTVWDLHFLVKLVIKLCGLNILKVLLHEKLDERLQLAQPSPSFPDWWQCGKHDKDLLIGVAK